MSFSIPSGSLLWERRKRKGIESKGIVSEEGRGKGGAVPLG
jgi:hypothetical protein